MRLPRAITITKDKEEFFLGTPSKKKIKNKKKELKTTLDVIKKEMASKK